MFKPISQQLLRERGELRVYGKKKLLRTCRLTCFLILLAHILASLSALSATRVELKVCGAATPLGVFGSRADFLLAFFNRVLFFSNPRGRVGMIQEIKLKNKEKPVNWIQKSFEPSENHALLDRRLVFALLHLVRVISIQLISSPLHLSP